MTLVTLECYYTVLCVLLLVFPPVRDAGCPSVCMVHGSDAEWAMNRQGFGGEKEVKRKWVDTSSPHGITLASASVKLPASPAAALSSDGAVALT